MQTTFQYQENPLGQNAGKFRAADAGCAYKRYARCEARLMQNGLQKYCLVARVATVDDNVGASHEARRVRGQEDAKTVQVLNCTQTVLGSQGLPDLLLGLEGGDTVEGSVHVTGRDAVDTDVVLGPLSGNGLAKLNDTGLGGVVAALLLRVVDDAAGHGGNEDNATGLASGHHGTSDSLGHQEGTSKVDVDETTEHGGVVGLSLDVGVGNTGRVDEDVRSTIHLDDGVDGSVDGSAVTNVNLEEGDREAGLLVQLSGSLVTKLLVGIKNDDSLSTGLSAGAGHVVTQTTSTTSDDDGLAEDAHALHGLRQGLVNLLGKGLDDIVLNGRSRAVKGNLGSTLGNVDGLLLTLTVAVNGDRNLLLADDALLVGGVGDASRAGSGEEASGSLRSRGARDGNSAEPKSVASKRHCDLWGGRCEEVRE